MKKFLRNLFSGYFIVLIILLLELTIFIFIQFFLEDTIAFILGKAREDVKLTVILVYLLLRIVVFFVAFFIFFRIVNKPEDPEFKIPWIVGMLLLPFFTSVIFLIFGNHGLRKKDRIIVEATVAAYNAHFLLNDAKKDEYNQELDRAVGTFKYINSITRLGIHKHNKITYYKTGEEFFPAFVEDLKNKFLTFLLQVVAHFLEELVLISFLFWDTLLLE